MALKDKKLLWNVLLPLLLLAYAMIGSSRGAELSDTMYSVGNYAFFHESSGSWHYATYLANLLGRAFFLLGGGRLLYIKLLCSLVSSGTALAVYFALKERLHPLLLFACELVALGLSWSPSVILYQHVSYLVLTLAALLLYAACMRRERRYMFLAGIVLGLGLFVRVSNAVYCALIVFVFWDDIRSKRARLLPMDSLCCIGGYLCGVLAALIFMLADGGIGGLSLVFSWIGGLLGGSSGGGGYTAAEMLMSIADNYFGNLKFAAAAFAGVALGVIFFRIRGDKYAAPRRILYTAAVGLLIYWYARNGVWDLKYYNVGSIFRLSVVLLYITAAIDIYVLAMRYPAREKALACMSLLVQLITPLGSNNHLYSCINNMYFILPAGVLLLISILRTVPAPARFPVSAMGVGLGLLILVQSAGFHFCFAFKDGTDGSTRDSRIEEPQRLAGMETGAAHAEALRGLTEALSGKPGSLLTFGDVPGLNYAFDMPPAISTLWPDLESYADEDFIAELAALSAAGEKPLCVLSMQAAVIPREEAGKKLSSLRDFMYNNNYVQIYANAEFVVLEEAK